jgi:hypothetical protein
MTSWPNRRVWNAAPLVGILLAIVLAACSSGSIGCRELLLQPTEQQERTVRGALNERDAQTWYLSSVTQEIVALCSIDPSVDVATALDRAGAPDYSGWLPRQPFRTIFTFLVAAVGATVLRQIMKAREGRAGNAGGYEGQGSAPQNHGSRPGDQQPRPVWSSGGSQPQATPAATAAAQDPINRPPEPTERYLRRNPHLERAHDLSRVAYDVLWLVWARGGVNRVGLAPRLGHDRAAITAALGALEEAGLVTIDGSGRVLSTNRH